MLSAHDYTIVHKSGRAIGHVDYLSRAPLPGGQPSEDEVIPAGIHLFEAKDLASLTARDIAAASQRDHVLRKIITWTQSGWPRTVPDEFRPYWHKKDGFSIVCDCLLLHNRIVIP